MINTSNLKRSSEDHHRQGNPSSLHPDSVGSWQKSSGIRRRKSCIFISGTNQGLTMSVVGPVTDNIPPLGWDSFAQVQASSFWQSTRGPQPDLPYYSSTCQTSSAYLCKAGWPSPAFPMCDQHHTKQLQVINTIYKCVHQLYFLQVANSHITHCAEIYVSPIGVS